MKNKKKPAESNSDYMKDTLENVSCDTKENGKMT